MSPPANDAESAIELPPCEIPCARCGYQLMDQLAAEGHADARFHAEVGTLLSLALRVRPAPFVPESSESEPGLLQSGCISHPFPD